MPSKTPRSAMILRDISAEGGDNNAISGQLRSLRRTRKMTLDALAGKTGLNKSYLSRIERGEKSPSVATLIKLAQAMEVPVATLFGEKIENSAIHLTRAKARRTLRPGGERGIHRFASLSKPGQHNRVESFVIDLAAEFGADGYINHGGEEAFFVLSGKVEVSFVDRSVAMAEGDYLQFPGHLEHKVRRLSPQAQVLVVVALD